MAFRSFFPNSLIGTYKTVDEIDSAIRETNAEKRKRENNGLDVEDQEAHLEKLYEARNSAN